MVDQPPKQGPRRENQTRLIVALVVTVLLVIFALQNTERARVRFLFFDWDGRVIYVIIVSAIAGAIAGWLVRRARQRRRGRRERDD
jgi:uncharacterized integral membrane protein